MARARATVKPDVLVAYLDERSEHVRGGYPVRERKYINGQLVNETDARMIRRWRKGDITNVTEASAAALLRRFKLDYKEFIKA